MIPFIEMVCIYIRGGHTINKDGIQEMGYNPIALQWEFVITCHHCNRSTIMNRQLLDDMLYGKDNPDGTKPDTSKPPKSK